MLIFDNGATFDDSIVYNKSIGFQHTITHSDNDVAFATNFYRALSDGWPVDAALVEGRKAIVNGIGLDQPDWIQPVLYMRAPDGQLFKTTKAEPI